MRNRVLLTLLVAGVVLISGCVQQTPPSASPPAPSSPPIPPPPASMPTLKIPLSLQATEKWLEDVNKLTKPPFGPDKKGYLLMDVGLARDNLALFFNVVVVFPPHMEIHYATRANPNEPFQYVGEVPGINKPNIVFGVNTAIDSAPFIGLSSNKMYFASYRDTGTPAFSRLWWAKQIGKAISYETPQLLPGDVNQKHAQDPTLTQDEKLLFFVSVDDPKVGRPGSQGSDDIWLAQWQNNGFYVTSNSQEILKNINTAEREFAPEISPDGLTLIFSRGKPPNKANLFVSYRSSLNEPFGSPQKINISGVSSNWYEGAALSPDQRTLYFDAFNPQGKTKIWQSSLAGYTREETIPKDAVKMTSQTDAFPPVLHSPDYENPIPLPGPINTAGVEDSPFFYGDSLYFWFTPDVSIPPEEQLFDGVTGIWVSHKTKNGWGNPERIILQDEGKLALDGCPFVSGDTMWFCSAREGYTGVNLFTAEFKEGKWQNWKYVGDKLVKEYQVGEMHIFEDKLYFHSPRAGGRGGLDVWVLRNVNGEWGELQNVEAINTPEDEGWPFITKDGGELWFTRTYKGSPGVFRSKRINGVWSSPELILSQFAGEPTLDDYGNIYFVHHFFREGRMVEADIYVAYKKGR